jgi:hypothetical protein
MKNNREKENRNPSFLCIRKKKDAGLNYIWWRCNKKGNACQDERTVLGVHFTYTNAVSNKPK